MKACKMVILILAFLVPLSWAGTSIRNGGDVLVCKDSGGEIYYLSLDSYQAGKMPFLTINEYNDYETALGNIITKLKFSVPVLGNKLENFVSIFKTRGNFEKNAYWLNEQYGVFDHDDESLYGNIPPDCVLRQAVIRVDNQVKRYYYDAKILDDMGKTEGSDELSWLLIHEWAWDYLKDPDIIMLLNGYLHSEQFINHSENEVRKTVMSYGVQDGLLMTYSTLKNLAEKYLAKKEKISALVKDIESRLEINIEDLNRIKRHAHITELETRHTRLFDIYCQYVFLISFDSKYSDIKDLLELACTISKYVRENE